MVARRNSPRARSAPMRVSDSFWALVKPLIPVKSRPPGQSYRREPGAGRKPIPARKAFTAITYILRTGSPWKALPKSFGSSSAIHRHFDMWHEAGLFLKLWQAGLAQHDEMEGIAWHWWKTDEPQDHLASASAAANRSKANRYTNVAPRIHERAWQPVLARRKRRNLRRNNSTE